jgi:hypothetical protein
LSQLTFFGGIFVCVVLQPHYLFSADEGGISNYGVHLRTAVPYSIALGGTALLVGLTARVTPVVTREGRRVAAGLWAFSILLVCVLATTYPYQHGTALKDLHIVVGGLAVGFEVAAATWAATTILGSVGDRAALIVEFAGGVLAACTLAGLAHLLFVSQLVTSVAFGFLLVRAAVRLEAR